MINGEGLDILWALHGEAWLEYTVAHMQAILDSNGEGLFEFFARDPDACLAGLGSHLPFREWVAEFSGVKSRGCKRL